VKAFLKAFLSDGGQQVTARDSIGIILKVKPDENY